MKKSILKIFTLTLLISLTSCNPGSSSSSSSSVSSSSALPTGDIQNDDLSKGQITYTDEKGQTQPLTRNTIYTNSNAPHLNPVSTGGQHVFVAPFAFKEDPSDSKWIEPTEELHKRIELVFSGTQEELAAVGGQISLADFYQKSSYGKAKFEASVMPWITYNGTAKDFEKAASGQAGVFAAEYVRKWYISEYAKADHGALGKDAHPFSYFDADNDGFMDLVWTVYAYPYTQGNTSFWWAYVTSTTNQANFNSPNVKTLAWASTVFMTEHSNGYDSHTFIHETGHTFGLSDYYDYNNKWKPMGGVDYMDQNIGDHNAYSKFQLGWVEPMVLKPEDLEGGKSAVITLNAFTNTGDALILAPSTYNNTAFDEYLIIELDGPTGIAKQDYINGYNNTKGFQKPGIRVLHVDARVHSGDDKTYLKTADEIGQKGKDLLYENTYGGRSISFKDRGRYFPTETGDVQQYFTEVNIIENAGFDEKNSWKTSSGYTVSDSALFHKNDTFSFKKGNWKTLMPSNSNLWDKSVSIGKTYKDLTITEENNTCDYKMQVLTIDEDPTYGYTAKVMITLE